MRNTILILFVSLFFGGYVYGQSGYFGSRYSFDAQINIGPSFQRSSKVINGSDGDVYARRLRLSNTNYKIGFSFVTSRKVEVGVAYEYARMRSLSKNIDITPGKDVGVLSGVKSLLDLMEDVIFNKNGISIKTLIYIRGSKAPVGKYFGFTTNFGFVNSVRNTVNYGLRGAPTSQSSFLSRKSEIDTLYMEDVRWQPTSGAYFTFRGLLGQNFPLTKKLMLNVAFGFPLIGLYHSGSETKLGAFMLFDPLNDDIFDVFSPETTRISGGDVSDVLINTVHKYNRLQFDIGIKYHF